jgi:hypothetical protein
LPVCSPSIISAGSPGKTMISPNASNDTMINTGTICPNRRSRYVVIASCSLAYAAAAQIASPIQFSFVPR